MFIQFAQVEVRHFAVVCLHTLFEVHTEDTAQSPGSLCTTTQYNVPEVAGTLLPYKSHYNGGVY